MDPEIYLKVSKLSFVMRAWRALCKLAKSLIRAKNFKLAGYQSICMPLIGVELVIYLNRSGVSYILVKNVGVIRPCALPVKE